MNTPPPAADTTNHLSAGFARFFSQRAKPLTEAEQTVLQTVLVRLVDEQNDGHSAIVINQADKNCLLASGLASEDGLTPLRVEDNRLYLYRYWQYEQRLAEQLLTLCQQTFHDARLESTLERYFGADDTDEINWQKHAARNTAQQALSIIVGGPGTGKTTTVVKILALLQELNPQPLHIALTAPTGKAAMRLQESIGQNKTQLNCTAAIKALIPEKVSTLHHLLGARPPSPYFRHHRQNPLPYDLIVVDETSMVDIALMSKLVDALKPQARLILLGDKDQLASVESGAVLADLMAGLPAQSTELLKTYRFAGAIKTLASAINDQNTHAAWACLQNPTTSDTALLSDDLISYIVNNYQPYLSLVQQQADFMTIANAFNQFQVLCSNRNGPLSVQDINHRVTQTLIQRGQIQVRGQWYAGRPVMISENNAAMQLYNGDIGLCLADSDGQLRVYFLLPSGEIKTVLPSRLPPCETVYAMTIHKSQGSEFASVLIVLPDKFNPVLNKELLYTAVTRAKKNVTLAASEAMLSATIRQRVQRVSGLAAKLATHTR